ncbi:MAG: hypothetical protein HY706_15825 [Candidatus Hydrogenedentes bacterium]|nr:hypothetical protein [Candidatus Hydrogenedentota bacterium]
MSLLHLAIEQIDFFLRNLHMRLPFRYGNACLVATPILHTRLIARDPNGNTAQGVSGDILPPKWFDKSPAKNYRQNIEELLQVSQMGARCYLDSGAALRTPFELWHEAYRTVGRAAASAGLNGLTASFGSSIIERAVLDAAARLAGCTFHRLVRDNLLGIGPAAIHSELSGRSVAAAVADPPLDFLNIRHTVGLADAILDADIPAAERLDDGLPQSLEAWIKQAGIRFFKIKIAADVDTDRVRLEQIATLLNNTAPPDYGVSLDGNELFKTTGALHRWIEEVSTRPSLRDLFKHVLFIEQPMDRSITLTPEATHSFEGFVGLPPLVIDESDDRLDAFKRAVEFGYRGTSVKNCKGIIKGLLNRMLVDFYNEQRGGGFLLTGEDLSNQPVVPLQEDLCTLSVLGIRHAERNGQHYCGTLNHLSERELRDVLKNHASLYEPFGKSARLRIRDGRLDLGSLQQVGYGVAIESDFESMTPLADWDYSSLNLPD